MNIDYKKTFSNEQKYNSINLFEASIYENAVTLYTELTNHENKNNLTHTCNPDTVSTINELLSNTKPCPKCYTRILWVAKFALSPLWIINGHAGTTPRWPLFIGKRK